MKNRNQTGLKNFKPKINLNHNIYITMVDFTSSSLMAVTKFQDNFASLWQVNNRI